MPIVVRQLAELQVRKQLSRGPSVPATFVRELLQATLRC